MIGWFLSGPSGRPERPGSSDRGRGESRRRGPDPRVLAFARGLAIGALFGAAVAGSRMWRRAGPASEAGQLSDGEG